jgi:competence protein ComEC
MPVVYSHAPRGDGFVVESWLENDGDMTTQEAAAGRGGLVIGERTAKAEVGGNVILLARGKQALSTIEGCGGADVLITDQAADERPCLVLDSEVLRRTGALAGRIEHNGLRLLSAEVVAGDRPWTRAESDRALLDLAMQRATP